ncbi:MAG: HD domain-containing protein [Gammaproteobacteria bacterium]|nr:MAG: HD domain-containing protein [Gammaproteobacteria bacterium]
MFRDHRQGDRAMMRSDPILDFLRFVEGQERQSVRQLLDKILSKSREMTGAEAGTIFIARRRGRKAWLEPVSIQNDAIPVKKGSFIVPIGPGTIAGYVADSGRMVRIDDVYHIPKRKPYHFDPSFELKHYRTCSMFCFPLKNFQDKVIGVVQLINARKKGRKSPVPFDPSVEQLVLPIARAVGHSIERAQMLERIRKKNAELRLRNRQIAELQAQTEEAFQLSIQLLARAAEIHDEGTGNHIVRVNEYSYFIARKLGMPKEFCDEIHYSAQLHDVGKMSVDQAVLKKKGRLNRKEREEMDRHTIYGYEILIASPRLAMGAEIALNHHEKWDGSGYPYGRKGEEIPISARIVALADVYDALRSERPYKPAFSHEKAVRIITEGDDRIDPQAHFDPALIALFRKHHRGFDRIWRQWVDD